MRPLMVSGAFMLVAAIYVVSGPGRIDIIDGQFRYEVARNLVLEGRPVLRDPVIRASGAVGRDGERYGFYGAPPSVFAMPLVWAGLRYGGEELAMALFSFTSALAGALAMAALLLFFLELGLTPLAGLAWTAVTAFATLLWPLSTSTFDQVQQALFALLATWLAWRSGREGKVTWAALGGAAAGVLFCYQQVYALWIPFLGLALFEGASRPSRRDLPRVLAFLAAAAVAGSADLVYNVLRFGDPLRSGKLDDSLHPLFGNPLAGLLGLLASPGKSLLLFSPPVLIAVAGWRAFRREQPWLARAVLAATLGHLALISSLAFYGGDWAWGPRYLVVLLPLWALPMPYALPRLRRRTIAGVVAAGVLVQGLALSLDHQRYFFERNLHPWFWAYDPWFYFRQGGSQLLARPVELVATIREGVPPEVSRFGSGPRASSTTYCLFGPDRLERTRSSLWMRSFAVFYLPRPWPLWMRGVPASSRPFSPAAAGGLAAAAGGLGLALVIAGLGRGRREAPGPTAPRTEG